MTPSWIDTEFMRPLVNAWIGKAETAYESEARKRFVDEAEEAKTFYSRSCAALWDSKTARKWMGGAIEKPKFPISVNKTFEAIAVLVPNMLWQVPYRNVKPKRAPEWDPRALEALQQDQEAAAMLPFLMEADQIDMAKAKVASAIMQLWLNYTSREVPFGGLSEHARLATIDAMLTGRGVQFSRTYKYPGSDRTLTGCFREDPLDVLIDPDAKRVQDAKWIMLRHQTEYWKLEMMFQLPADSLKDAAALESGWSYGERAAAESTSQPMDRAKDVVVWYEVWSKMGPGCRLVSGMEESLRKRLQDVVGEYAYVAFTSQVPWPLNCPPEKMRGGMTDEQVKEAFSWPIETWADNRWPCEFLDWYPDPDCVYPIAPMSPGMGHLKFINVMVPFLCERTHSATRNFWAVAAHDVKDYKKYLDSGAHNTVIPVVGAGTDDVRKAIAMIEQPAANADAWRVIEMANEWFSLATGLTPFMYGMKGSESNDRSARETEARAKAAGIRIDYMQKEIAAWQSRLAAAEAFAARWFVVGNDIVPLAGQTGKYLWDKYIRTTEVELVVREMEYEVAASSIARPDRDRDLDNWSMVLQTLLPQYLGYAMQSGDFEASNTVVVEWGKAMQIEEPERLAINPQANTEAVEAAQQAEQQQMALEQQKLQLEVEGKQLDIQGKQMEMQGKQQLLEMQAEGKMLDALVAQQKARIDVEAKQRSAEIEGARQMQSLQAEQVNQEIGINAALAQAGVKIGSQAAQAKQKLKDQKAAAKAKPKAKPNSGSKK
jgi:hypothetical protein